MTSMINYYTFTAFIDLWYFIELKFICYAVSPNGVSFSIYVSKSKLRVSFWMNCFYPRPTTISIVDVPVNF